jgi:NDP-sugar pyrophosphorylase family protein
LKALILAGGFATRLRPLSCTRPKQLFPIINKPLLDWVVENLERNGVREIVVAVNYMADALRDHYEERHTKATITFSLENRPLGTAGPIKQAEPQLKGKEPFLVINGDILSDMNLKKMKMTHDKTPSLATIALRKVEDASRFGVVDLDEENYIRRFVEKPKGETRNKLINAGAYILSQEIFDYIPAENRKISIEKEIFPILAKEGKMRGYITEGLWMDIGTHPDYLRANFEFLKILGKKNSIGRNAKISPNAKIVAPVAIGNKVVVDAGAKIGPLTVIGDDSKIDECCTIERSVIFPRCLIESCASIKEAIVGEGAVIGRGVVVEKRSVIGDHCEILDNVIVNKNVTVCPSKEVRANVRESSHII